jgi:hypothetical protein
MLQYGIKDIGYSIGGIWARKQLVSEEIIVCMSSG